MARWEVCELRMVTIQEGGWGKKRILAYQARQVDPSGVVSVIAEERFEPESDFNQAQMTLVARLGFDGWEPMIVRDHNGTYWYFKRQL